MPFFQDLNNTPQACNTNSRPLFLPRRLPIQNNRIDIVQASKELGSQNHFLNTKLNQSGQQLKDMGFISDEEYQYESWVCTLPGDMNLNDFYNIVDEVKKANRQLDSTEINPSFFTLGLFNKELSNIDPKISPLTRQHFDSLYWIPFLEKMRKENPSIIPRLKSINDALRDPRNLTKELFNIKPPKTLSQTPNEIPKECSEGNESLSPFINGQGEQIRPFVSIGELQKELHKMNVTVQEISDSRERARELGFISVPEYLKMASCTITYYNDFQKIFEGVEKAIFHVASKAKYFKMDESLYLRSNDRYTFTSRTDPQEAYTIDGVVLDELTRQIVRTAQAIPEFSERLKRLNYIFKDQGFETDFFPSVRAYRKNKQ